MRGERGEDQPGRRIARLFRKMRQLPDVRACNIEAILASDEIDICESGYADPGYTACLVRAGKDIPAGIILAPGQRLERRRFSIAHELGHLFIPTHESRGTGWCGEEDMSAGADSANTFEWEANDFAAELLMPRHLFARDIANVVPAFRDVSRLAGEEWYQVSITAAALRYVELTRHACALVASHAGRIQWVTKSDSFVYRIPWRGDRVPSASLAYTALTDQATVQPRTLDPYSWLELQQRRRIELFESTHVIPSQSQVLSLVWVVEDMFAEE